MGTLTARSLNQTVDEYFVVWIRSGTSQASAGWRNDQIGNYERYVRARIGSKRLRPVTALDIAAILEAMRDLERAPQTRLHVYNLLHKMFRDAIESFELLPRSPVRAGLRPVVPRREVAYLKPLKVAKLLEYARDLPYGLAVWLQLYLGLRVGEVQALRWKSVDLDERTLRVEATYVRKERRIQNHPKGKRCHTVAIPPELAERLRSARGGATDEDFVVSDPARGSGMMSYDPYLKALKRYCRSTGLPTVASHGLRHSTSGLYMEHGASRQDLRQLFQHSSSAVTDRYIHGSKGEIDRIAAVIRLFPTEAEGKKVERISG